MNRYIWSFDGKTIAEQPYVIIKKGEIIELELVNDTMMHHPMHDMSYLWGVASLQTQMSSGLLSWMNPKNNFMLAWEVGWEKAAKTEHEVDLTW